LLCFSTGGKFHWLQILWSLHILTLAVCSCALLVMCKGGGTGGARGALAPPILDLRTRTLCTRTLRMRQPPWTYICSATSGYVCVSVVSQLNYQRTTSLSITRKA